MANAPAGLAAGPWGKVMPAFRDCRRMRAASMTGCGIGCAALPGCVVGMVALGGGGRRGVSLVGRGTGTAFSGAVGARTSFAELAEICMSKRLHK
jgi:hypothetical protein